METPINQALTSATNLVPVVGMPASICSLSDRHPATVIAVNKSGKKLTVRKCEWKVISGSEHDGSAQYEYSEDPEGAEYVFSLRKDGRWVEEKGSNRLSLGHRSRYYDPHF